MMAALIENFGGPLAVEHDARGRPPDLYGALLRSITGQQLSVKAARAIYGRLIERFGGRTPTPAELLADDPETLRAAAGLSRAKVAFLRDLADRLESGDLRLDDIEDVPDQEVADRLIEVKGVGQWTVDMYLLFHRGRPDVLPVGDLGVRRAAMIEYHLRKLPQPKRLITLARPWRPWR